MKIGMVFPAVEYGGQEKNLIKLSNELHKNKYEIEILTYGNKKFSTANICPGIKRVNLKSSKIKYNLLNILISLIFKGMLGIYLKSLIEISKLLVRNEYATLICFQSGGLVSLLKIITKSKTKIITRESTSPIHMAKIQKSSFIYSINIQIKKIFYQITDLIVANSTGTKNEINELINEDKAILIENICDFSGTNIIKSKNFHSIFKTKSIKLISVGRLNKTKRIDILLKSVKEVLNIHTVDLILIGDGPERSNLSKLSKELNISNNVHFIGFSNQAYNWINNSDIYLSSSIVEGSPNSIIESVCLGIPVIAADCFHGPKEILDNGKIGLLVPINNIKEMTSNIILLIENKILRERYSELSVEKKPLYSKERISQIYIREINKLNETI